MVLKYIIRPVLDERYLNFLSDGLACYGQFVPLGVVSSYTYILSIAKNVAALRGGGEFTRINYLNFTGCQFPVINDDVINKSIKVRPLITTGLTNI